MLFGSLLIHEFAHAAAAHVLHVAMSEIRLTPFGGAARIENPYAVSAPRVFAVAGARSCGEPAGAAGVRRDAPACGPPRRWRN